MRLGTLSALDTAGVRPHRQADGSYYHACVACGSAAMTGNWHTQCSDPSCAWQIFSPLDLLAVKFDGDHRKAAALANDQLRWTSVTPEMVEWETTRRTVMDFWLHKCLASKTTLQVATQTAALREKGWFLLPEQRGITVLTGEVIAELVQLAEETGASFPGSMRNRPPTSAIAYVVQTVPHTIDRIIITTGKSQECKISWVKKRVGIIGMLGLSPDHLITSDYRAALSLQRRLQDLGQAREVAAIYVAKEDPAFREPWRPDIGKMTTVVGGPEDVVTMAAFYDAFPLTTDNVMAIHHRRLVSSEDAVPMAWTWMRRSYLAASIEGSQRELSGTAIRLLEQSHPTRDEIAWLIQRYREQGRLELADDIKRHMDNRVIVNDGKLKIRETASEYLIDYGGSTSSIANFALSFTHNLFFRDSADMFHQGRLNYGRTSLDVTIGAHAIDNINELQKTVRHQMLLHRADSTPEQLPTVIDSSTMRRHVIPHLKRQVSALPSKEGFCNMGWTVDRGMFVGPSIKVTLSGREFGPVYRHPNVLPMRHFDNERSWDVGFATELPLAARDVIAMTLASCVRFFVKSITRPVCILHSPAARHLLKTMFAAMGQREIFELNPNLRDQTHTQGVRGYPFLVTGYNFAQTMTAKFGHVILTDTGYSVGEEVDQADAEAAGRSLQFGLLRVVEWCLATGAEEFSEAPAMSFNSSLLREGRWLVEHVCELQPWEVSDGGLSHLEDIFAQIPVNETNKRLRLEDGVKLTADMVGLKWDRDGVREDLLTLKSRCEGEGDSLVMEAVAVMPAMELYYGQRPEVTVVV